MDNIKRQKTENKKTKKLKINVGYKIWGKEKAKGEINQMREKKDRLNKGILIEGMGGTMSG